MQSINEIILNNPVNLKTLLQKYSHSLNDLITYSIGYDCKIYILLRNDNYEYSTIVVDVDWDNSNFIENKYYRLGKYDNYFNIIQPIENNLLLIESRCSYNNIEPEKNAIIVDYNGNVINEFCLGDGIEDCIVNKDNNIITSYFDEGIFGSNGWDNPIGANGLVVWNKNGEIVWKADKDIDDCYAINIDEDDKIWYYYYSDFKLIKTDMKSEKIYDPHIEYSHAFLITPDSKIIFKFNNNYSDFVIANINDEKIENYQSLNLMYEGKNILVKSCKFRKSNSIFIDNNDNLFIKKF